MRVVAQTFMPSLRGYFFACSKIILDNIPQVQYNSGINSKGI
jgi:hypothetical protein